MTAAARGAGGGPGHRSRVVGETRAAVAAVLERSGLAGSRLLVAVSGGQDSMALLDALHSLSDSCRLDLTCAHFDHGLRGAESAADAEFVRDHCVDLGIRFIIGRAEAAMPPGDEAAAREARYAFLSEALLSAGGDAVAVGHSATDQAETVLLNLVRGAGIGGLSAMREDSVLRLGAASLRLIRPLLAVTRDDLGQYCLGVGISARIDSSNESDAYTRNRVRRRLMPMLRTFNPAVEDSLARLARNSAQAEDFLEAKADRHAAGHITEGDDGVAVSRGAGSLPPAVASALLRRAVSMVRGDLRDIGQVHIDQLAEMLARGSGRSVDLPGGIRAVVADDAVVIRRGRLPPQRDVDGPMPVEVPGAVAWSGWTITAELAERGRSDPWPKDPLIASLDPGLSAGEIWIRGWRAGDRIKPLGMTGTRKVKDLLIDLKVPRADRGTLPLIVTGRGIAWVAGCRIAEWAKVPPDSGRLLRIRASRTP